MTGTDAHAARPALLAAVADGGIPDLDDCLAGLAAGWRGRRHVTAPDAWGDLRTAVAAVPLDDPRREAIADTAARLDALFGDPRGIDRLAAMARDAGLPAERRAAALDALVDARAGAATAIARQSLAEPELAPAAIRALLVAGDAADAVRLVEACRALDGPPRDAALAALASRAEWGTVLLDAIERGDLPRDLLGALLTRQIGGLGDAAIRARVAALVGPGGAAGPERIDAWQDRLGPARLAAADPAAGRGVWQTQCAACHRMHGEGGSLGPDLTGSGRRDLDYLLANIVTPSATVSPDYRMKQVVVADGRVLSGIVVRRTAETLLLRTQTGEETIPLDDVEEVIDGGVSLMPDGLLDRLDEAEVADLFRFLMEP
jgi:putative heme-binding domain-containing protein